MLRAMCVVFAIISAVSSAPQDAGATIADPDVNEETKTLPADTETSLDEYTDGSNTIPESKDISETTPSYESKESYIDTTLVPVPVKPQKVYEKKKPSPRFLSKLSYFKNTEDNNDSGVLNFIERTGKRKFRSRCRCEKITNCPKLQITVPRCPEEQFMCCF